MSAQPAYVVAPIVQASVAVADTDRRFPVRRIFCVGRNYAAHAREMGKDPDRDPPFFFTKPADAVVDTGTELPYPPLTANLHHEIELVVAIGKAGFRIPPETALDLVWGYGVGIDLTRRDLQSDAKEHGRPWDWGKAFDRSAPCAALVPVVRSGKSGNRSHLAGSQRQGPPGCRPQRTDLAGRRRHRDLQPGRRAAAGRPDLHRDAGRRWRTRRRRPGARRHRRPP